MGRNTTNLSYQMTSAIAACTYDGHSKRTYKQAHNGDTDFHVFGLTYKSDLCETAKDAAKFIRSEYPSVRMVRDITPGMIQAYLDHKSTSVRPHTMEKIYSHVRKISLIIEHTYNAGGWRDSISMPPTDTVDNVRNKTMRDDDFTTLLSSLRGSRSDADKSIILSRYAGLRLEESVSVRVDRYSDRGGRWGYGTLDILPGDGSKGNRPRHVDIPTAEARDALREAVSGRQPGQLIVSKPDGSQYDKKSITRTVARHMDKIGIAEEYKQNKNHSLRKRFAQESYDVARRSGMSREEALAYVNLQLGHSGNRADLSAVYVEDQW